MFGNQAAGEFIDKVHRLIEDNGKELVGKHFPQAPEKYLAYLFSFITYGLIGMIRQWFQAETDLDKHAMVMLADRMVTSATESLLTRNQ